MMKVKIKPIHQDATAGLNVTWRTPLGPMTGLLSEKGIQALRFPPAAEQKLDSAGGDGVEVEAMDGPAQGDALQHAAAATEFLRRYFAGQPEGPCPPLDWAGASAFDRAVWEATRAIPRGQTLTYGELARRIGHPGAARAVGGALGRNPLVLLVPCHRVIGTAAGARALCGFTGGLALKRHLLAREGVQFA